MNILILTEGGSKLGFGHLTRCLALYQAFEENGIIPRIIVNGDEAAEDLLKDVNYRIFNWLIENARAFEIIKGLDIVIIDSYLADLEFYKRVSSIVKMAVYIDDYNRLVYPEGIIINYSIYVDRLNYSKKNSTTYLMGKDYAILRKEFWNILEKKVNRKVKNILITCGGINHSDLIYKIVNYLKNKFDFNFYIIDPKRNKLDAEEMLNLMLKVDICISGGGLTTYELARLGVPTIGICFFENQRLNLEGWQEKGFLEYIGWYNDENLLEKIAEAINKFMPYKERARRAEIGKNHVYGKGTERIVNELLKQFACSVALER